MTLLQIIEVIQSERKAREGGWIPKRPYRFQPVFGPKIEMFYGVDCVSDESIQVDEDVESGGMWL